MKTEELPTALQSHLKGYTSDGKNLRTKSCADVFLYTHPEKEVFFLKVRNTQLAPQEADLLAEKTAISWLQGQLNVPEVVLFYVEGDTQYLLMTQVAGVSGVHREAMNDISNLIREFASGLREIHSIDIDSCPFDWRMERYVSWVEGLIEMGALDNQVPAGRTKSFLREELSRIKAGLPKEEDLVFTHGDYCLPNIILQNGHLPGFIDWGYAGIGDRYRDFVAADYTIRRNLGSEWVSLFFEEYGLGELDEERLLAYRRVHDFIE